jgi:peptide-methionine (R)-S-oxide reductase
MMDPKHDPIEVSEEEWKRHLSNEQYHVLREKGTEPPFSGQYNSWKEKGIYHCAACQSPLFSSATKFDSNSGWPSFTDPLHEHSVRQETEGSSLTDTIEITCPRCSSHLGHLVKDGSTPTGKHYRINSLALEFRSTPS